MRKIIVALVFLLALTSCSGYNNTRGIGDAPVGVKDRTAAHVVEFSDGFENVEWKCVGKDAVFTSTRDAAPVVVANDPNCK